MAYSQVNSKKRMLGCLACLAILAAIAILIAFAIQYSNQQSQLRLEQSIRERNSKEFDNVKNGADNASLIGDVQLLAMLASDPDCINNLKELHFSFVEITPEDAAHVAKLANLRYISFYDSSGMEYALEQAHELPIEVLFFESGRLPDQSLRDLLKFNRLKEVYILSVLSPNDTAILESFPPDITVKYDYPIEH